MARPSSPDRLAVEMPVLQLNDQRHQLRPGQTRLGGGTGVDLSVNGDESLGVQAVVEVGPDGGVVIRRSGDQANVRVNGIVLGVEPTPLLHGDRVEIGGSELFFADDAKAGATQVVAPDDVAAIVRERRAGARRTAAAIGGRLVSLVDGKEYAIPDEGIVIGRDASCDVVVPENDVSRQHAQIVAEERGYVVRDRSANGVFVNGERVQESAVLARSDVLRIGTEEFRFHADAAAPAAPEHGGDSRPLLATLEIINEGAERGKRIEIRTPRAHVGRGAHNDVVLANDSVSDAHATLTQRADGWYIADAGSTNGTWLAGARVTTEQRIEGTPDVRFGGVKAIFRAQGAPAERPKGTRAFSSVPVDRAAARSGEAAPAGPVAPGTAKGTSPWIWLLILAAVVVVAFLLINR